MLVVSAGLALSLLAAAPVAVHDASPPSGEYAWWGLRAADRLAGNLGDLGLDVAATRSLPGPRPGFDRVEAEARVRDGAAPSVTWVVRDGPRGFSWSGPLDQLEAAAAEAAVAVARGRGARVPRAVERSLPRALPLPLQRLLGRARRRELDGHPLQAALMYERASNLGGRYWYEAARAAVRARSVATGDAADAELAKAAAVRASVAARAGDGRAEAAAWRAFSKYTPHRLRPWSVAWTAGEGARVFSTRSHLWIDDGDAHVRLELPAPSGPVATRSSGHRIEASGPAFLITSDGATLRRVEAGAVRWTRASPVRPVGGLRVASGFVAVWNREGGAWLDAGLGRVRARFEGAVMADGDRGLALRRGDTVAFLRAGQATPAWTRDLGLGDDARGRPVRARLTEERVVIAHGDRLRVLRARNGQPVGEPIPLAGRRLLHADGRHAVVADAAHHQVIDILSVEARDPQPGPGRAVGAASRTHGVAIAFETGDVLLLDADGALQARALLPRAPVALVVRHEFGVILAVEPHGVHAIGDIRADEATDIDALLALARLAERDGRPAEALRLAEWAARPLAGAFREAEVLRAQLLPEGPVRQWALARARAAGDRASSLSGFGGLWPVDGEAR
jgi:hypothetical protein